MDVFRMHDQVFDDDSQFTPRAKAANRRQLNDAARRWSSARVRTPAPRAIATEPTSRQSTFGLSQRGGEVEGVSHLRRGFTVPIAGECRQESKSGLNAWRVRRSHRVAQDR